MKIKWTNGNKIIPKVGIVNTGDILEVVEDLGKALVKQGQAKKVIEKKSKGGDS